MIYLNMNEYCYLLNQSLVFKQMTTCWNYTKDFLFYPKMTILKFARRDKQIPFEQKIKQ